jgi:hypothetical protein
MVEPFSPFWKAWLSARLTPCCTVERLRVIARNGNMPHLIISGMPRSTIDVANMRHLRSMLIDV